MRYVEDKKEEETKVFSFKIENPIKVNEEIITEGIMTVYDEEVKDSKLMDKSIKVGNIIVEKGSYIIISEKKRRKNIRRE